MYSKAYTDMSHNGNRQNEVLYEAILHILHKPKLHCRSGSLVLGRPTVVREDPGSNLTAAGGVYHNSHCNIQPWARVVHPYCSA